MVKRIDKDAIRRDLDASSSAHGVDDDAAAVSAITAALTGPLATSTTASASSKGEGGVLEE